MSSGNGKRKAAQPRARSDYYPPYHLLEVLDAEDQNEIKVHIRENLRVRGSQTLKAEDLADFVKKLVAGRLERPVTKRREMHANSSISTGTRGKS